MAEEIWKDIQGYERYYAISNLGNVYSKRTEKILIKKHNPCGYEHVTLSVNGTAKSMRIHRLVATAFIPNPENKPTVNHINEIKTDNRVENLEWATNKEQNNHGTRIDRVRKHTDYKARKIDYSAVAAKHDYRAMGNKFSKPVSQYDQSQLIRTYTSLRHASDETGISISHICACLKGRYKTAGGWTWKYAT